jgi:hypothetical protein
MANPFPMAAVVLPAASNASVIFLTDNGYWAISAIPPALSDTGPYPSIERQMQRLDSIPKAAMAIPYIPAREKEVKIVIDKSIIGTMHEL